MGNRIFALITAVIILFTGCSLKETNSKEQNITVKEEKTEISNISEKIPESRVEDKTEDAGRISYNINKEFKQGEVTTTVHEIMLSPENGSSESSTVIKFNINVRNGTEKDIYMVYDISPLVLNTGEQIDFADKCDIHRVFKSVVKDGALTYNVNSKIEDIKTLRWVLASPLHNGTQLIGQECDFTFILDKYEKGSQNKAK